MSPPSDSSRSEFQEIYDEFHPKIRRYLSRLVGSNEAEDLAQEVFIRVSQSLGQFRGDSKLSTWVYRIATNAALDRLRSPSFPRKSDASARGQGPEPVEASRTEHELVRGEMNECIREYVDRLPPNYRSVVALSEGEELTNHQIADVLGISVDTVKIRLHRARARLKQVLGSGCTFYRNEENELACERKGEDCILPPPTSVYTIGKGGAARKPSG